MKRFILEQSDDEFYTSHSGLALVSLCINKYSDLSRVIGRKMDNKSNAISHADLLRSYLDRLCIGKSDYEAITSMRMTIISSKLLGVRNVPSAKRLRQRLDEEAKLPVYSAKMLSGHIKKRARQLSRLLIPATSHLMPMSSLWLTPELKKRKSAGFS